MSDYVSPFWGYQIGNNSAFQLGNNPFNQFQIGNTGYNTPASTIFAASTPNMPAVNTPAPVVDAVPAWSSGTSNPIATTANSTGSGNSLFSWGQDKYGNNTFAGGTGLQWLGAGVGIASSLYGMYQANKQMKLAQQNFDEQKRLNHANYRMQAKSYNNSLRNQQSGRSYIGMSGSAKAALGKEYNTRKADEDY